VAGLGQAGGQGRGSSARFAIVLVMKGVGMERRVLGAQQVHQAQRDEGGSAEPRLDCRRQDPTGHAVAERRRAVGRRVRLLGPSWSAWWVSRPD